MSCSAEACWRWPVLCSRNRGPCPQVTVRDASVVNAGWEWAALDPAAEGVPEAVAIRGYELHKKAAGIEIRISGPGVYEVIGEGSVRKL